MDKIISALYFIAVLSVLVIAHEWGHFIVAKLCGMRVDDFSLFFGKVLIRLGVRNGTVYNIRSIPLGGFVKIAGMEPDDISNGAPIFRRKDPDNPVAQKHFLKTMEGLNEEALANVDWEQVSERVEQAVAQAVEGGKLTPNGKAELQTLLAGAKINADEHRYLEAVLAADSYVPDPAGYNQKPLWQRAAVIFAGPFMSLFLGYFIFCAMGMTAGLPYDQKNETVIESVARNKPADRAGLKSGDRITRINDTAITDGNKMVDIIHDSAGKPLQIQVERSKGEQGVATLTLTVTPEATEVPVKQKDGAPVMQKVGLIGMAPRQVILWRRYDPVGAVKCGTEMITNYVISTLNVLTHPKLAKDNVGGPLRIVGQIHQDSKEGPWRVLFTAAMLSISLGIMNLLPIPILDGGHLMLLAVEGIRRRKLTGREVYAAQLVGLSIIGLLFVLVMYNDIMGFLRK